MLFRSSMRMGCRSSSFRVRGFIHQFRIVLPAGNKYILKGVDGNGCRPVRKPGIGIVGDNEIHLAGFQQIHAAGRGLIGDLNVNPGVLPVKPVQIGYQEIAADGVAGSDTDLAAPQGAGLHDLSLPPLDQVYRRLHVAEEDFPFGGQLHPFGAADKEGDAQLFFQNFDGLAYR